MGISSFSSACSASFFPINPDDTLLLIPPLVSSGFATLKNCVVVIKNVPCMKCEQCGEDVLSADTVARIERILHTVKKAVAEITVVNFPDCAA